MKLTPHQFLSSCKKQRILVIGDIMVDRYLWGTIDRISPEAPVPVVDVRAEEERLGGAGNVAINLAAMGAAVDLIGVAGDDEQATRLVDLLASQGFGTEGMVKEAGRRTSFKTRVLSQGQQLLRIDRESVAPVSSQTRSTIQMLIESKLPASTAVILQDYDKGLLTPELISWVIGLCADKNIPVFVDPKFRNFFGFGSATVFKPNWRELSVAMGIESHPFPPVSEIIEIISTLRAKMPHQISLVTLGSQGMLCVEEGNITHIKGQPRNVSDVSGAGDTVLSVMALGMASGLTATEAATYANLAGGIVCEESGVVPVNPEKLAKEAKALSD